jgi:hypothetical protein
MEHGSLSLNSLAYSLGNLGTRKKTYNFNVFLKNGLIVKLKFQKNYQISDRLPFCPLCKKGIF